MSEPLYHRIEKDFDINKWYVGYRIEKYKWINCWGDTLDEAKLKMAQKRMDYFWMPKSEYSK